MFINVSKKYDNKIVLNNFTIQIPDGKITCILGDSGAGKTTLLNILAGITDFEGKVEGLSKDVSYVFQTDRLIPNLTVEKNLEYVLKAVIKDNAIRSMAIRDMLFNVGLFNERNYYPSMLSGGMAQRVSMARAFLYPHQLLLLDEPFRELDIGLKKRLTILFKRLYERENSTVVFVTHDIDEALMTGDKICVLKNGSVGAEFNVFDKDRNPTSEHYLKTRARIYDMFD